MRFHLHRLSFFVMIVIGQTMAAAAQEAPAAPLPKSLVEWQAWNVQYLYGWNWSLGSRRRDVVTFEHSDRWRYGDNFFFVDVSNLMSGDDGTGVYGEWHPRLSFGRLTRRDLRFGIVKDVLTAHEIGFGDDFSSFSHGLSFALDVGAFEFANVSVLIRDDTSQPGHTWQAIADWNARWARGAWSCGGYVDASGAEGDVAANVISEVQLLYDVGGRFGRPGTVYAGMELRYWHNEFGIRGVDERVPQAMIKWSF